MVEVFGTLEKSVQSNGQRKLVWRIPALTASIATQRAKFNTRFKGINNFTVDQAEKVDDRRYNVSIVAN